MLKMELKDVQNLIAKKEAEAVRHPPTPMGGCARVPRAAGHA